MSGHIYTVEFRMFGPGLDPQQVSSALGLASDVVTTARSEQVSEGVWAYSGAKGGLALPEWDSLERGLDFLLTRLWPYREAIRAFDGQYKMALWCGHFQS